MELKPAANPILSAPKPLRPKLSPLKPRIPRQEPLGAQKVVPLKELEKLFKKNAQKAQAEIHYDDEIKFGDLVRFYLTVNNHNKSYLKYKDYTQLEICSSTRREFDDEFKIIPALRVTMLDKASNFKKMLEDEEKDEPEKVFASAREIIEGITNAEKRASIDVTERYSQPIKFNESVMIVHNKTKKFLSAIENFDEESDVDLDYGMQLTENPSSKSIFQIVSAFDEKDRSYIHNTDKLVLRWNHPQMHDKFFHVSTDIKEFKRKLSLNKNQRKNLLDSENTIFLSDTTQINLSIELSSNDDLQFPSEILKYNGKIISIKHSGKDLYLTGNKLIERDVQKQMSESKFNLADMQPKPVTKRYRLNELIIQDNDQCSLDEKKIVYFDAPNPQTRFNQYWLVCLNNKKQLVLRNLMNDIELRPLKVKVIERNLNENDSMTMYKLSTANGRFMQIDYQINMDSNKMEIKRTGLLAGERLDNFFDTFVLEHPNIEFVQKYLYALSYRRQLQQIIRKIRKSEGGKERSALEESKELIGIVGKQIGEDCKNDCIRKLLDLMKKLNKDKDTHNYEDSSATRDDQSQWNYMYGSLLKLLLKTIRILWPSREALMAALQNNNKPQTDAIENIIKTLGDILEDFIANNDQSKVYTYSNFVMTVLDYIGVAGFDYNLTYVNDVFGLDMDYITSKEAHTKLVIKKIFGRIEGLDPSQEIDKRLISKLFDALQYLVTDREGYSGLVQRIIHKYIKNKLPQRFVVKQVLMNGIQYLKTLESDRTDAEIMATQLMLYADITTGIYYDTDNLQEGTQHLKDIYEIIIGLDQRKSQRNDIILPPLLRILAAELSKTFKYSHKERLFVTDVKANKLSIDEQSPHLIQIVEFVERKINEIAPQNDQISKNCLHEILNIIELLLRIDTDTTKVNYKGLEAVCIRLISKDLNDDPNVPFVSQQSFVSADDGPDLRLLQSQPEEVELDARNEFIEQDEQQEYEMKIKEIEAILSHFDLSQNDDVILRDMHWFAKNAGAKKKEVIDYLRNYFLPQQQHDQSAFFHQKTQIVEDNTEINDKIMLKTLKVLSRIIDVDMITNIKSFATSCGKYLRKNAAKGHLEQKISKMGAKGKIGKRVMKYIGQKLPYSEQLSRNGKEFFQIMYDLYFKHQHQVLRLRILSIINQAYEHEENTISEIQKCYFKVSDALDDQITLAFAQYRTVKELFEDPMWQIEPLKIMMSYRKHKIRYEKGETKQQKITYQDLKKIFDTQIKFKQIKAELVDVQDKLKGGSSSKPFQHMQEVYYAANFHNLLLKFLIYNRDHRELTMKSYYFVLKEYEFGAYQELGSTTNDDKEILNYIKDAIDLYNVVYETMNVLCENFDKVKTKYVKYLNDLLLGSNEYFIINKYNQQIKELDDFEKSMNPGQDDPILAKKQSINIFRSEAFEFHWPELDLIDEILEENPLVLNNSTIVQHEVRKLIDKLQMVNDYVTMDKIVKILSNVLTMSIDSEFNLKIFGLIWEQRKEFRMDNGVSTSQKLMPFFKNFYYFLKGVVHVINFDQKQYAKSDIRKYFTWETIEEMFNYVADHGINLLDQEDADQKHFRHTTKIILSAYNGLFTIWKTFYGRYRASDTDSDHRKQSEFIENRITEITILSGKTGEKNCDIMEWPEFMKYKFDVQTKKDKFAFGGSKSEFPQSQVRHQATRSLHKKVSGKLRNEDSLVKPLSASVLLQEKDPHFHEYRVGMELLVELFTESADVKIMLDQRRDAYYEKVCQFIVTYHSGTTKRDNQMVKQVFSTIFKMIQKVNPYNYKIIKSYINLFIKIMSREKDREIRKKVSESILTFVGIDRIIASISTSDSKFYDVILIFLLQLSNKILSVSNEEVQMEFSNHIVTNSHRRQFFQRFTSVLTQYYDCLQFRVNESLKQQIQKDVSTVLRFIIQVSSNFNQDIKKAVAKDQDLITLLINLCCRQMKHFKTLEDQNVQRKILMTLNELAKGPCYEIQDFFKVCDFFEDNLEIFERDKDKSLYERFQIRQFEQEIIRFNYSQLILMLIQNRDDSDTMITLLKKVLPIDDVYENIALSFKEFVMVKDQYSQESLFNGYSNNVRTIILENGFNLLFVLKKWAADEPQIANRLDHINMNVVRYNKYEGQLIYFPIRYLQFLKDILVRTYVMLKKCCLQKFMSVNYHNYVPRTINRNEKLKQENQALDFFLTNSGYVEINKEGKLYKMSFPLLPYQTMIAKYEKEDFLRTLIAENDKDRIPLLIENSEEMMDEMRIKYEQKIWLSRIPLAGIFISYMDLWISMDWCCIILLNSFNIFSYTAADDHPRLGDPILSQQIGLEGTWAAYTGLGIMQLVFATFYVTYSLILIVKFKWAEERRKIKDPQKRRLNCCEKLGYIFELFGRVSFLYKIGFLVLAYLGFFIHPFLYTYHLIDIAVESPYVQKVLLSLYKPGKEILHTFILFLVLMYVFAIIAYTTFYEDYEGQCVSLSQCLMSTFDMTFKADGGLGGGLAGNSFSENFGDTSHDKFRFLFDNLYNLILLVLIMEIVAGIIIDTFGQMREELNNQIENLGRSCFICGELKQNLPKDQLGNGGFKHHRKYIHNLFHYLYFIEYVKTKPQKELTGMENYVLRCIESGNNSWFPIFIDEFEESSQQLQMEQMMVQLSIQISDIQRNVNSLNQKNEKEHDNMGRNMGGKGGGTGKGGQGNLIMKQGTVLQ